ncbi:FAD-dependent oxidoreductase [Streptomonospora nanhaiensis]|uniref:FAD-dependent oxidoreductase n=1 Tax=Streptomonospora nanhaiensis TaxID=1323731 RepID=UPI001C39047A|nr:FAD-dependent monooxygenase [Streptomonospora nanhaiensis]MBV2366899.1 FAD-dependent monooxygenase [Streptomonospora nanhaiensis]MBX9390803.1 FAD-dependent monooxygenase [Streptomonospora nanhaiensis]
MVRVVVVGGGIGGLAVGAGLRRRGIDVAVFDRDTEVAATGGYHITLDGRAQTALRELLPPEGVERLLASSSALRLRDRDAFWDRRGRLLGHGPDLAGDPSVDIDRITLRTLLAEAVGDDLHLGRTATEVGYADGTPRVGFADTEPVTGDLVVGADGTHSLVARYLAGGPTNTPAGIIGFSGRTPLPALSPSERQRLGPRSSLALGGHGAALYVGFLDPVGNAALDRPELRMAHTTGPTYIWGAMLPESSATGALRGLHGEELRAALLARFAELGWSEHVLEVLARADPHSVAAFRFNAASTRARDLAPWPAGRITALGDAVHATPPTAGMGAGVAIRDAADLVDNLGRAGTGTTALTTAVDRFEAGTRRRGSAAITRGMATVRWILATDTALGAAATTLTTPLLAAATRLLHRR